MSIPIILISPEARAKLAAEAERSDSTRGLRGGLLFGYPCEQDRRLVVSSARLSGDVGFGQRTFSLDQTRTSRQLAHAQDLDAKADYCGVWYLHRTPNAELIDDEWLQAQTLLEDPDFHFDDLVCLVLCFYSGELRIHAASFNRHQSTRGQAPTATELRLTTDWFSAATVRSQPSSFVPTTAWYKAPDVATRLSMERDRLAEKYQFEPAMAPDGQMFFRLSSKRKYKKLSFYLAVGHGFPEKAPHVFLLIGGRPHRISTPSLGSWSADKQLVDLADELVDWLAFSKDEYLTEASTALSGGRHRAAADLLTVVLAIDPRTPGAARKLAQAQARL